jgi:hypothetical protein
MTWSYKYVVLFCRFPHCQTTIRTHNFMKMLDTSVVTWCWGQSLTRLIVCWLLTIIKSLKPIITTCTADALITINVFHHFMVSINIFHILKKKFNVNMLLMNISYLEYRKTHTTHTITNTSRATTNHSRMMRQKGRHLGSTPLGSTTYPT